MNQQKEPVHVLHLEDNPLDVELIMEILATSNIPIRYKQVEKKEEYENELLQRDYDLILCDNTLPGYDGISALKFAKETKPFIPFVFVSGTLGEEKALEAMRYGASDYVNKSHPARLKLIIEHLIEESNKTRKILKLNQEIRDNEERMRLILQATHDIIYDKDFSSGIYSVSEAFREVLGYDIRNVNNELFRNLLDPDSRDEILRDFQAFLDGNQAEWHSEYKLRRNDGTYAYVIDRGWIIRDHHGKPLRMIGAMIDITRLHEHQQAIEEAKIKAEASDRLKSVLLATMSHELRTPMNGILGFSQLLMDAIKNPELKSMAGIILKNGSRMMTTIKSILGLAQIVSNQLTLHNKVIDLPALVQNVAESYRSKIREKNLKLISHFESVLVMADSEAITDILNHVLDNAIKFTNEGSITLDVKKEKINDKNVATVTVTDTGIGISPGLIEHVFEEFRQASEGWNRSFEGLGLGLTLSRHLCRLMNGEILLESDPGKGTIVILRFPDYNPPSEGVREAPVSPTLEKRSPEVIKKVLLVEDNDSNQELVLLYLQSGFDVQIADSGIQAIEAAATTAFDLILMDINLPGTINGTTAMHRIREIKGYKDIPVIAMTGYAMDGDRESLLESGFNDYIAKPFTKRQLEGVIQRRM